MRILAPWAVLAAGFFVLSGCSDGSDTPATVDTGPDKETVPPPPPGCDPLTPTYCGFPYPNNYWTQPDTGTVTGLRLSSPAPMRSTRWTASRPVSPP